MAASDEAVEYILRRVCNDSSFAWVMVGTEALAKCIKAFAERTGESEDVVRERIEKNAASVREKPEIVDLREKVEELTAKTMKFGQADDAAAIQAAIEHEGRVRSDGPVRAALQDLLWSAECGNGVLTVENLRRILDGKRVI